MVLPNFTYYSSHKFQSFHIWVHLHLIFTSYSSWILWGLVKIYYNTMVAKSDKPPIWDGWKPINNGMSTIYQPSFYRVSIITMLMVYHLSIYQPPYNPINNWCRISHQPSAPDMTSPVRRKRRWRWRRRRRTWRLGFDAIFGDRGNDISYIIYIIWLIIWLFKILLASKIWDDMISLVV